MCHIASVKFKHVKKLLILTKFELNKLKVKTQGSNK